MMSYNILEFNINEAMFEKMQHKLTNLEHSKETIRHEQNSKILNSSNVSQKKKKLKSMKEDFSKRKAPPVGQYNPKIEAIKGRSGKLTYLWMEREHSKVARERKHKLKVMLNKQPV
jgi:hypothetical protein